MKIVLVIEDDAPSRRAVAEVLLGAGYGVCEGWSAELIPMVPRLHVVVSDVVVGKTADIAAITAWARKLRERFDCPVVLLTGRSEVAARPPASLGVADVILKPFNADDLLARVDRASQERAA